MVDEFELFRARAFGCREDDGCDDVNDDDDDDSVGRHHHRQQYRRDNGRSNGSLRTTSDNRDNGSSFARQRHGNSEDVRNDEGMFCFRNRLTS